MIKMPKRVKNLVVDTSAFIKNAQLQDIAENIYTVQEVIDEVKNNRQIKSLAVLPYQLEIKQADAESIKVITDFAKKTGDFAALSITDINVLALTYELEKRFVGVEHLKSDPIISKTVYTSNKNNAGSHIAGFYNPENKSLISLENEDPAIDYYENSDDDDDYEDEEVESESSEGEENDASVNDEEMIKKFGSLGFNTIRNSVADDILQPIKKEENSLSDNIDDESNESQDDGSAKDDFEVEKESSDEEGWITPSNITNVKKNFGADVLEEKEVEVACITTDFAMQNVLKQIGLNVTSLDGRIIKHVKTFILRCHTCFKTASDVTKIFCPKCGHKTMKRVSVSVNEKGEQVIHLNPRKEITAKFKNQPIPRPRGGKHAVNPLLFQDQIIPQQRVSKKGLLKTDALDENYTAGSSPFVLRDCDSRSSKLRSTTNIKQWMKNYEYDNYRRGYKRNK